VTLSANFLSVIENTTQTDTAPGATRRSSAEHDVLRRCKLYAKSFREAEIAVPANELRITAVARWIADHSVAVEACTGDELHLAIAKGIRPARIVVDGDALSDGELSRAVHLGVGRVIVGSTRPVELLAASSELRTQGVLIRSSDRGDDSYRGVDHDTWLRFGAHHATDEVDHAITAVLASRRLSLQGLHAEVGSRDGAFPGYPTAINHLVAEMDRVRRDHGRVLTRLSLHNDLPLIDTEVGLRPLADQTDDAIEEACAGMRFPRPRLLLSLGAVIDAPSLQR
jgi:diaminopimelate decarboxylase